VAATATVGIVGGDGRELEQLVRDSGFRPTASPPEALINNTRPMRAPDAVLVDVRADRNALAAVAGLKRKFPATAVAIVAKAFEPELMLEAMRAGVSEVIVEPLAVPALKVSLERIIVPKGATPDRRVIAVVGAKGGVGATTIAVNLAEALARTVGSALLVDLHVGIGDSSVFLGVEPRFTVIDALENTQRLDAAFLKGLLTKTRSGLELLGSSARVVQSHLDPQHVRPLLEFLGTYAPVVVLDVPRQDLALLESLDSATSIFVVVNQELPTVKNAHSLVKRLQQRYGDRVEVIVNRADKNSEITLDDIRTTLSMPIAHVLPNDYRQAMSAANKGQPLAASREGRLAESFYALARTLVDDGKNKGGKDKAAEESSGLFGWLSKK
jgi:pilus assembly protein CpaE